MKRQLTLKEYRLIDLTLFALMLVLFEFLIVRIATNSFFTVSLAAAVTTIVYMRWGWWGGLHAAAAGGLFCLYYSGTVSAVEGRQYLIYILGNLFSLAVVPVRKAVGPERIRQSAGKSVLFALAVILLMQLGRAVVALVLGTPWATALGFFTADTLSVLFTVVVAWIARRLDGVMEDQKHYLLRIQKEDE